jgi:hypothetical protein
MAKFTPEQTKLIVEKLLDIMENGSARMRSAGKNMSDPTGDGMGFMLAILNGRTGHDKDSSFSAEEIERLRVALIRYISPRDKIQFVADYGIEYPLSEIMQSAISRVPMVLPMKSSFRADAGGASLLVIRVSNESWTFEQLKEEYRSRKK